MRDVGHDIDRRAALRAGDLVLVTECAGLVHRRGGITVEVARPGVGFLLELARTMAGALVRASMGRVSLNDYDWSSWQREAISRSSIFEMNLSRRSTYERAAPYVETEECGIDCLLGPAVEDGATVPIYYESRLAKLELNEAEKPRIDPAFEEVTEGEEERKEKLKTKWAALEAIVGSEKRLGLIARDLVEHFEQRQAAMDGKAMIVCMSRRIAVAMYDELVKLRPEWGSHDDATGALKVVMTGGVTDPPEWQQHIRSKERRKSITERFKRPDDPLKIVIVRDMLLTGFDAPPLHTMYIDKPLRAHTLMQAIARVNRVFRDKPGGLVVDYLGLANELRTALATYTQSHGRGDLTLDQQQAVRVMQEKYEVVTAMFHGFDWQPYLTTTSQLERLAVMGGAIEHVLAQEDGKPRVLDAVSKLSAAFALAVPHDDAIAIRDDVWFFQSVRAALAKRTTGNGRSPEALDHAVRQIVSKALVSDEVVDIFKVAGLDKPDIGILSDEFLAEVRGLPQRNLAVELLQRLLNDTIKKTSKQNVVKARSFSEMLEQALRKYQARSIEAAQVIEELIQIAKDIQAAEARGEELGLTPEEVAFYDALAQNESAVEAMGDDKLKVIAAEVLKSVQPTRPSTGRSRIQYALGSDATCGASSRSTATRPTSKMPPSS